MERRNSCGLRLSLLAAIALAAGSESDAESAQRPEFPPPAEVARVLIRVLEKGHISRRRFDGELARRTMAGFAEGLDPGRLVLTQPDVDFFVRSGGGAAADFRRGELRLPNELFDVYAARLRTRSALIQELLPAIDGSDGPQMLAAKWEPVGWPADEAEARVRWRAWLTGHVSLSRTAGMWLPAARKHVQEHYRRLFAEAAAGRDEAIGQTFMAAVASAYDSASGYWSPSLGESLNGHSLIGRAKTGLAVAMASGFVEVRYLVPGSPAARGGQVRVGDRVVGLEGKHTRVFADTLLTLGEFHPNLSGQPDSVVRLRVLPAGAHVPNEVAIRREDLKAVGPSGKVLPFSQGLHEDGNSKVALVAIPHSYAEVDNDAKGESRYRTVIDDARRVLLDVSAQEGVTTVVLDLRGSRWSVAFLLRLAGLFLDGGPVMLMRDSTSAIQVFDADGTCVWKGPLAVLVDENTVGGAEVLAAALKDRGRALVIGSRATAGDGRQVGQYDLSQTVDPKGRSGRLGHVFPTRALQYRITGLGLQYRGVEPHIVLPDGRAAGRRSSRVEFGLPQDVVEGIASGQPGAGLAAEDIARLVAGCERRRADSPFFQRIEQEVQEVEGAEANLAAAASSADAEADPYLAEVLNVVADYVAGL